MFSISNWFLFVYLYMMKNKEIEGKQIAKNVSLSLLAQVISISVSFILGFVVPKFIDEYQYAYWQTFLLYVGYVGVLHFGLLDGIVLRYSQYDYEELDKQRIRSQFVFLLGLISFASIIVALFGLIHGGFTQTIAILVAFGILSKNIFTYNSFLFQTTNRISQYAFVVVSQRLVYGCLVVLLVVFNHHNYIWYCIADLAGDCAGIFLSIFFNKDLHFGKLCTLRETFQEAWLNVSSGILLMFSNWTAMLSGSIAKMIIEWKWGALVFGKTSFAFNISNVILLFVSAISVVLFPSLKRMNQETLPKFYKMFRDMVVPILFWSLLLYYPECWILEKWLPKYSESLIYLGILSPIVVYASVVSLLTNNYLKAYRQERLLLLINMFIVFFSTVIYYVSAYWFESFKLMLLAVVTTLILRSIVSEIFVMKLIHVEFKNEFIIEFIITCAFLFSTQSYNRMEGFFIYLICLIIYSFINRSGIKALIGQVRGCFSVKRRKSIEKSGIAK